MHKKKLLFLVLLSMALALATANAFANTINGDMSQLPGAGQNINNLIVADSYGGTLPVEIVVSSPNCGDSALNYAKMAYVLQSNSSDAASPTQIASTVGSQNYFIADMLAVVGSFGGNYHTGKFSVVITAGFFSVNLANS